MNRSRLILHVDDDPDITRLMAARLAKFGYESKSQNDPRRVIDDIQRGEYRVVLVDIDMPYINGLELLKHIKMQDGGIQVIMLTGIVTMTTVLQSLRLGAEACLFKPIRNIEPLVNCVDDAFRKIDRWWQTLEELSNRRLMESPLPPHAAVNSNIPA